MKKNIFSIFVIMLTLLLSCKISAAGDHTSINEKNNIYIPLKLHVYENEKDTEHYIVGSLVINNKNNVINVYWNSVFAAKSDLMKAVVLSPFIFSTDHSSIENIIINDDKFSFTVLLPLLSNRIEISGHKEKGEIRFSLICEGIFKGLEAGDKPVHVEWRQVDKVILPYKEVR